MTRSRLDDRSLDAPAAVHGVRGVDRLVESIARQLDDVHTAIWSVFERAAPGAGTDGVSPADLDEIGRQARRGRQLTRHLSVLSAGSARAHTAASPNAVIRNLEYMLRDIAGSRHAVELDIDVHGFLTAVDPHVLELIVLELARRAAEVLAGGTIRVVSRCCRGVSDDRSQSARLGSGDYLRVDVCAVGATDSACLASAHDPAGAEITLALSELAMTRLRGLLTVRRRRGELAWSLSLPGTLALTPPRGAPSAATMPGRGTVLVVDDETPVRDIIARALAAHGYTVLRACNGEDALDVTAKHAAPIHLVVSDIVMPEMDGARLFEHLRAWYPALRFLLMSGYTRGALEAEQLRDGVTRFLAKPFGLDDLVNTVDAMFA